MKASDVKPGLKIGHLTAVEPASRILSTGRKVSAWVLRCDCGQVITAITTNLVKGKQKSCGCKASELARASRGAVGVAKMAEYSVYRQMRDRCELETSPNYKWYGGRGIKICQRWRYGEDGATGFECFIWDMGRRPNGMTLDRVDTNGPYSPDNCRWATWLVQANNARSNRVITVDGASRTISEWARASGVSSRTISERLDRGWPERDAVMRPATKRWSRAPGARVVLIAALCVLPLSAEGHDWYPMACCSGDPVFGDCRPAQEGDIQATRDGWLIVPTGDVVPYGDERPSPDGEMHWCHNSRGTLRYISGEPCLWVPGGMS